MERRSLFRCQLSIPVAGFVEQEGRRFAGNVLNLSLGGFFLRLSRTPANDLVTCGASDYGEIRYAGRDVRGFGQIVRIESGEKGIGVAFLWDSQELDESSGLLINEIVAEQAEQLQTGYRDNFGF